MTCANISTPYSEVFHIEFIVTTLSFVAHKKRKSKSQAFAFKPIYLLPFIFISKITLVTIAIHKRLHKEIARKAFGGSFNWATLLCAHWVHRTDYWRAIV
jgi:hypothetical protein